jgi:hypothetical protein
MITYDICTLKKTYFFSTCIIIIKLPREFSTRVIKLFYLNRTHSLLTSLVKFGLLNKASCSQNIVFQFHFVDAVSSDC